MRRLKRIGVLGLKMNAKIYAGIPDRLFILPHGLGTIWVELKSDSGKVSELQWHYIRKLRGLGCEVLIVRGLEGADAFFDRVKRKIDTHLAGYFPQEDK